MLTSNTQREGKHTHHRSRINQKVGATSSTVSALCGPGHWPFRVSRRRERPHAHVLLQSPFCPPPGHRPLHQTPSLQLPCRALPVHRRPWAARARAWTATPAAWPSACAPSAPARHAAGRFKRNTAAVPITLSMPQHTAQLERAGVHLVWRPELVWRLGIQLLGLGWVPPTAPALQEPAPSKPLSAPVHYNNKRAVHPE